jgi:hypothetical protein
VAIVLRWLGPLRLLPRFLVELVARYLVLSYLRSVSVDVRNLYWLRETESPPSTPERTLLRRVRQEPDNLTVIFERREIGLPSFVIAAS